VDIDEASRQAFPFATKAFVLWQDIPVVQRIVGEGEAIGFYALNCLHFTGEPLKPTSTNGFLISLEYFPKLTHKTITPC
jgi:hypothetical protein